MQLDIENHLPDGVELTTGNPESVNFDGDKSHVIMRFAIKSIESEPHAELKAQYAKDVELCKSIDGLNAWQLWQKKPKEYTDWNIIKPISNIIFYADYDYRRHPHADLIIQYHKCSDADKARWECFDDDLQIWRPCRNPAWQDSNKYRLKPRTITINGKEYNAPLNVATAMGADYWVIHFSSAFGFLAHSEEWLESELDISALQQSHAFATEEDCQAVADAFNQILAGAQ